MTQPTNLLSRILANDLGVDGKYRHGPKCAMPGEALEAGGALLKWYGVYLENEPIPGEITQLARAHLKKTPPEARGLGFVILHRCGNDFYFLIVSTWRGNNEIWETVFYKNGDAMKEFALFPRDGQHKPTFCVWELVPLWHEQKAWVKFLSSKRDTAAAEEWLRDVYSGPA